MLHSIPSDKIGPFGEPMARAVQACVHCGFCLAECPTYRELGQEMDTPRGRILLMKQVLEGTLDIESAQTHIDRCLGCLACEPACPSGVQYRDLISPFRVWSAGSRRIPLSEKLRRFIASQTIPFASRFRLAMTLGRLARPLTRLLPKAVRPMLDLLPASLPARQSWPAI